LFLELFTCWLTGNTHSTSSAAGVSSVDSRNCAEKLRADGDRIGVGLFIATIRRTVAAMLSL